MTLSGGIYAHAFNRKQPPGEKHWPLRETPYTIQLRIEFQKEFRFNDLIWWLALEKYYGAEYYDEDEILEKSLWSLDDAKY